jgi:hypothetical protein
VSEGEKEVKLLSYKRKTTKEIFLQNFNEGVFFITDTSKSYETIWTEQSITNDESFNYETKSLQRHDPYNNIVYFEQEKNMSSGHDHSIFQAQYSNGCVYLLNLVDKKIDITEEMSFEDYKSNWRGVFNYIFYSKPWQDEQFFNSIEYYLDNNGTLLTCVAKYDNETGIYQIDLKNTTLYFECYDNSNNDKIIRTSSLTYKYLSVPVQDISEFSIY